VGIETPSYRGFRYPAEIISHCVWLYHRFPLSLREVQEMVAQRGVVVSHETVRQWCSKLGQTYANGLRRACASALVRQMSQVCHETVSKGGSDPNPHPG
jgi:transposase-like protein